METFQWASNNNNNNNNKIIITTTTTVRMIIIIHHHLRQLNRDNNKSSAINLPSSSCSWRCFWSRLNDFDWTLGSGGWPHADDSSAKPTGKKKKKCLKRLSHFLANLTSVEFIGIALPSPLSVIFSLKCCARSASERSTAALEINNNNKTNSLLYEMITKQPMQ